MPKSGLTYGVDISSRSQLIDGLNSQRVFFDDAAKLHELEPTANPFLAVLLQTSKKKASGDLENYIEHRGSYITDALYYVKANTTAIKDLPANAADLAGFSVSLAPGGAAIMPFRVGDVLMLVNPLDETQTATIIITVVAATATYRLLTAAPGFDIVKNQAGATKVIHMSRAFAEGSEESEARYETPVTCWNEIGSFKESFQITDQLSANTQIQYGNEVMLQLGWAQQRIMRDVDRMLLTASRRINATGSPFGAPGSSPLLNAAGEIIRTSISVEQGIQAADTVGIAGPRVFKLTGATLTPDIMDATVNAIHEYGSDQKYCFAGAGAMETLTAMSRKNAQYQMHSGETKFGLKWKTYQTPLADINIHHHRGMKGRLHNAMFIIDAKHLHLRQLIPMYTEPLVTNRTARKWELRWDIGLRMYLPEAHSMVIFV